MVRCVCVSALAFILSIPIQAAAPKSKSTASAASAEPRASAPVGGNFAREVLPNGIIVGVVHVPGAERVAVETLYKVGFMHEPAGMPQVTHLLEHLVAQGKIPGYGVGEVMQKLNATGMANAETLPSFTHYDYVAPSADLEKILAIEAGRLTNLVFDAALIKAEAAKCQQEAEVVERNPQAGMLKHAFMAMNQGWQHRARAARVRSGLETLKVEDVREFHKKFYNPRNLIVLIVGGVSVEEGMALAKKTLSPIPAGAAAPAIPVQWENTSEHLAMAWDSKVRAFCLAYTPPEKARDRLLLTLLGTVMLPKLSQHPDLQLAAHMVFTSNTTWPVGALPFFIYAVPKTNISLLKMQQMIIERIEVPDAKLPSGPDMQQLRLALAELVTRPNYSIDLIRQQASTFGRQMNMETSKAVDVVLANIALQLALREVLLDGITAADLNELGRMTAEEIESVFAKATQLPKQTLNILLPEDRQ
ncbi:MAG TPA: insulinase family protein [Methylomirabilota bacterium]|nr:insulinase family protein [Methylomirabilota bacterium]